MRFHVALIFTICLELYVRLMLIWPGLSKTSSDIGPDDLGTWPSCALAQNGLLAHNQLRHPKVLLKHTTKTKSLKKKTTTIINRKIQLKNTLE